MVQEAAAIDSGAHDSKDGMNGTDQGGATNGPESSSGKKDGAVAKSKVAAKDVLWPPPADGDAKAANGRSSSKAKPGGGPTGESVTAFLPVDVFANRFG